MKFSARGLFFKLGRQLKKAEIEEKFFFTPKRNILSEDPFGSVGPTGVCWAVDKKETVWRRLGAKSSNPIGSKWQSVTGRLAHITVGQAGVWGISPKNEVIIT